MRSRQRKPSGQIPSASLMSMPYAEADSRKGVHKARTTSTKNPARNQRTPATIAATRSTAATSPAARDPAGRQLFQQFAAELGDDAAHALDRRHGVAGPEQRISRPGRDERTPYRLRSEEHTSELQSRENLVCRLLLEKKKKKRE